MILHSKISKLIAVGELSIRKEKTAMLLSRNEPQTFLIAHKLKAKIWLSPLSPFPLPLYRLLVSSE